MTSLPRRLSVLLLVALAAITIASRWKIISGHASPVPFHDQWSAEGTAMFEPWFAGKLDAGDFWKSSNEHRPVLTRLLAFAEFRVTGEWNTRLQMLVNSLFHGLFAVILALIARRIFGPRGWVAAAIAIAACLSLPCTYENAMWGFQAHFYLMMLLGAAYLAGTMFTTRIGRIWVLAQLAGLVSLLTIAGAMLAPVAVACLAAVRLIRRRDGHTIATLLVAVALAVGGWATIVPANDPGGVLKSRSVTILVEAALKLLAWPSAYWFIVPLMLVPWLLVAVRALFSRAPDRGEDVLCVMGAWILLQALAISYGRGSHMIGLPPRYFDSLIVGVLVNAACLAVLLRSRGSRIIVSTLAVAWTAATGIGLWQYNKPSWIGPIIKGNGNLQRGTFESVRDYIKSGNPTALTRDAFIAHHFPSIKTMRRLLDNPGIRASLPATLRGESSPSSVERFTDGTLASWRWLMGVGILGLAATGIVIVVRAGRETPSTVGNEPVPWRTAAIFPALAAVVLIACGMHPWETNTRRRLGKVFDEAGEPAKGFEIPGAARAVYSGGGTPADLFFGTFIKADSFEGEKVSTEFPVTGKFLLLPVTGYPSGPGNSLRIEVLAPDGSIARTMKFSGGSPGEIVGTWSADVGSDAGRKARLILVDGSSKPHGWLGVGTPLFTDDPEAARRLDIAIQSDRADDARRFPAVLLGASVLLFGCGFLKRREIAYTP